MNQNERLYSGTFFPSTYRRWITYYSFQSLFYLFYGLEKIKEWFRLNPYEYESSSEMRAVRNIFSLFKNFKNWSENSLYSIRQPFLSIVTRAFRNDKLLEIYPSESESRIGVWTGLDFNNYSRVVLYIHGGGYVSGDIAGFLSVADKIATILKCPVFIPEYRLVPEHAFQDAVDDLVYALKQVIEKYPNIPVCICGDSAGGGLTFRLINKWIDQEGSYNPIYKCVVWSPMIDLNPETWINRDDGPCLNASVVKFCADLTYQTGEDYPWDMKWELFPETRIVVCKDEILFNDSRKAYQLLQRATLEEVIDSFHGFPIFWEYIPEALQEIYNLNNFFQVE